MAFVIVIQGSFSYAQDATPTLTPTPTASPDNSSQIKDLQNQISDLEKKVSDLQGQEKTLSSEIAVVDSQIALTQLRISATEQKIAGLELDIKTTTKKISRLEGSVTDLTKVLLNRIVATYQIGSTQPFQILLVSNNVSDFFTRLNYLKITQAHDKQLIYDTVQAKNDYANEKAIFEDKKKKVESLKKELESYTVQLDGEKKGKQTLLAATKNDESRYQALLAQARSEYQAIQGIVAGNGTETETGSVSQGQSIATIIEGTSCNSSGGHVHFIVSKNAATQNPFSYLKSVDYENCSGSSCGSSDGDAFNPSGSWDWPTEPKIRLTQGYGVTWAVKYTYVGQIYNFHNGIDITGSSLVVKAVRAGVLYQGSYAGSNGCRLRYVRVHHNDDGLDTFYLHVNYIF